MSHTPKTFLRRLAVVGLLLLVMLLGAATSRTDAASIAFVQQNYSVPQAPQRVVQVKYRRAQTAGNLNVVLVGWNDSTTEVQSVTDSSGNAYRKAIGPTIEPNSGTQSIYYATRIAAASGNDNTVVVTFSKQARYPDIRIAEYSGIDSSNPVDVVAGAHGRGTTSSSGSVATTNSNDLIVGANLVGSFTQGAGPDFTIRVTTQPDGDILEDRIVSSTGTYSATAPLSQDFWVMQMVAFRGAGSTPPPPSTSGDLTPPSVAMASPAAGAQLTGTTTVSATASDNVGVSSVTFLVDGVSIGADTSSPYTVSWNTSTVAAGAHTLQAQARDSAGNVGTSTTVSVSVVAGNRPPSISLSTSTGLTYTTPASVTLVASATDSDGTVSRVDFYVGATQIGSDSTSPFGVTWTTSTAGVYVFTAIAVDNTAAATTSAAVSVTVNGPSPTGTAMFLPSTDDSIVQTYLLDVFPSTADPTTAHPAASQDLGKPALANGQYAADISATLSSLPSGTYVATVSAVASSKTGRSVPSSAFSITNTSMTAATIANQAGMLRATGQSTSPEPSAAPPAPQVPGRTLWVTNSSTYMVAAFDATTGDVLGTVPVGVRPTGIAAPRGAGKVYVADEGSDTISVVGKASMTRVTTIALPPPFGRKPHFVSDSPDGSVVYVAEAGSNAVDVIDTASDRIAARFAAGQPGSTIRAAIADPGGQVLYALSRGDEPSLNGLAAIDAATGRWLWTIPIGDQGGDLAIASDGGTALVSIPARNVIRVIDLARRLATGEIYLGAGNAPDAIQFSADGSIVVTLHPDPERVGIVDVNANLRIVSLGVQPSAWAAAADVERFSYVSVSGADGEPGVIAVDPISGAIVRRFRFPGGGVPEVVLLDPH